MGSSGREARLSLVLAALAFSACSGGAGGSSVPSTPAQSSSWPNAAQLALAFTLPSSATQRKPAYVSPSSRSIRVTLNSVDGAAPPSWVTPNPIVVDFVTSGANADCSVSGSKETCMLKVPGPPGNVSYTFELFDASDAAGNELGSLTQTVPIAQGDTTPINVTIEGIAASVAISGAALVPSISVPGAPSFERLSVAAKDADGNVIAGSAYDALANSVQLSVSDPLRSASLSTGTTASCPGSTSVTLSAPKEPVWLCYTGQATADVSISASVPGGATIPVTLNAISFAGTTLCTSSAGCAASDPNYGAPTLFFGGTSGAAATRTLSATELGWTQAPYGGKFDLTLDPATCGTGSAIVSAPVNPATSWTLTALHTGICKGILTEHTAVPLRTSGTAVWFSVTDASVTGS